MKKSFKKFFLNDKANKVVSITILMNIILTIMKVIGGYTFKSRGLVADGLHSLSDVATSVGVIIGVTLAKKPRDDRHQYGHEKIETVITLFLSIILLYTGGRIGMDSANAMIKSDLTVPGRFTPYIALFSVFIKEWQYQITYRTGKKINSNALIADAWHHRSDALSSIAVFIGLIGSRLGFPILDPIAGLVVALLVIKVGFDIFRECLHLLIDVSIELDELDELKEAILKEKKVRNISDIRTRIHGSKVFVDIRICVDADMNIAEGHDIAVKVEDIIKDSIRNVKDVIVHLDPYDSENND